MRIGIIGGSFNPPHKLHEQMGIEVLKHNLVDKVVYVPTGDRYAKDGLVAGLHRYEMVKLMCKNHDCFEVSNYEVEKGSSYTYETLDYFQAQYPNDEIYFILSTDLLLDIMNWKRPEYILKNYRLIGLKREGIEYDELPLIYKKYPSSLMEYDFHMKELSSTFIREQLSRQEDETLSEFLNEEVLTYIQENQLYKILKMEDEI